MLHSCRVRSTTGPLSYNPAKENESNAFPVSPLSVAASSHSHPPGIVGPGVWAEAELSQHGEHAGSMTPTLRWRLDQRGRQVEGD